MKWLTRAWAWGELGDDEYLERERLYLAHLRAVRPLLSRGAERLIDDINLHDAQIQFLKHQQDGALELRALVGDLQVGYELITLSYLEADLRLGDEATLDSLKLDAAGTEIIYDEIDVAPHGRFTHSVLLWPDGEYEVTFAALIENRAPATAGDRR